ncbi:MAG: hypothetical protein WC244_02810 [Patescibacteria group bacterium]
MTAFRSGCPQMTGESQLVVGNFMARLNDLVAHEITLIPPRRLAFMVLISGEGGIILACKGGSDIRLEAFVQGVSFRDTGKWSSDRLTVLGQWRFVVKHEAVAIVGIPELKKKPAIITLAQQIKRKLP